ncbi:hypothetical protein RI367_004218 [Sorochytrium milnesiophthora]
MADAAVNSVGALRVFDRRGQLIRGPLLSDEEPFSLETYADLIAQFREKGKSLILARVETQSMTGERRHFFYEANSLNKLLFRKFAGNRDYIFRLYMLNPLTNTDITGDIDYFIVDVDTEKPAPPAAPRRQRSSPGVVPPDELEDALRKRSATTKSQDPRQYEVDRKFNFDVLLQKSLGGLTENEARVAEMAGPALDRIMESHVAAKRDAMPGTRYIETAAGTFVLTASYAEIVDRENEERNRELHSQQQQPAQDHFLPTPISPRSDVAASLHLVTQSQQLASPDGSPTTQESAWKLKLRSKSTPHQSQILRDDAPIPCDDTRPVDPPADSPKAAASLQQLAETYPPVGATAEQYDVFDVPKTLRRPRLESARTASEAGPRTTALLLPAASLPKKAAVSNSVYTSGTHTVPAADTPPRRRSQSVIYKFSAAPGSQAGSRNSSMRSLAPAATYKATYFGNDDDFLTLKHMRQLFEFNALNEKDVELFNIPVALLLNEGIILPDFADYMDNMDAYGRPLPPREEPVAPVARQSWPAAKLGRFLVWLRAPENGKFRALIALLTLAGYIATVLGLSLDPSKTVSRRTNGLISATCTFVVLWVAMVFAVLPPKNNRQPTQPVYSRPIGS